ncbi:hypothetical protein ACLI4Z_00125 [Natrialbaceae archaeon A-arb3/5]
MSPNAEPVDRQSVDERAVTAAIDEIDGQPHLVIADLTRDDAWLSMAETDAISRRDWR